MIYDIILSPDAVKTSQSFGKMSRMHSLKHIVCWTNLENIQGQGLESQNHCQAIGADNGHGE